MSWFHHPKSWRLPPCWRSCVSAGREICGKIPISSPSNIHPRNAAASTSHLPAFEPAGGGVRGSSRAVVSLVGIGVGMM